MMAENNSKSDDPLATGDETVLSLQIERLSPTHMDKHYTCKASFCTMQNISFNPYMHLQERMSVKLHDSLNLVQGRASQQLNA